MKKKIVNPILRGFNPDPSIVRVGEDYYIATSTFEWWPGVQIHHSRDLINWELLTHPLNRVSQLDLRGVGASQGVWAPCLTYADNLFYLVYTVVNSFYCNMYDTNNYLVTAADIMGPWSDPIPLNNFGFDPSLFHDDDGRKYMVSMVTDHRVPKKYAGRLILQEYSHEEKKMIGEVKEIYQGDKVFLEGPHIFKRGDYYYLFSADTGTGEGHGQSIQRSKSVWGPYEWYEKNSILTSRENPEHLLQKSGHCDLVETQNGEWYAVHLCGRALENRNPEGVRFAGCRRYTLGRETAIQKMEWTKDDWLVLANHTNVPEVEVEAPNLAEYPFPKQKERVNFDDDRLPLDFQSLRIPLDEHYCSLTARKGYLRMYGRSGLSSKFSQSLIARRWTELRFEASTCLEYEPKVFKNMAGLICMYDTDNYFYLHVTHDEEIGACISILTAENKKYEYPIGFLPIPMGMKIYLKVQVNRDKLQFFYSTNGEEDYKTIGPVLDASILSDEACAEGWFTGAMVGICCQDLTGFGTYADFDYFEYKTKQ
ncbi:glycoside hydrolase family 43 protein [Konateibacter massiliensis]|uniref:glycoside hydrolase family 43 protein n=1 Tax=Konateibacter massiliensis TaxID=2002841 RepID=UPI000C1534EB|nr:glycoside hydrolase family 43 protein [Konateibacter massiliensis]